MCEAIGQNYRVSNPSDTLLSKQRFTHPTRPPPAFWDSLSEIPLTRSALRELDRRNSEEILRYYRLGRPVTRGDIRKWSQPAASTQYHGRQTHLKRFARQGGPDLTDLRGSSQGRREHGSASLSNCTPTLQTTSTKSTGPHDRAFQQNLIDHRIYPYRYQYPDGKTPPPPRNLEDIARYIKRRRRSLSPSRFSLQDFRRFQQADADAFKEGQVMSSVVPFIEGEAEDGRCVCGNIPLTNLEPLTNGLLAPGNPDRYYGARPEQLDQRVRAELSRHIVPSTQHDLPIVPNFFVAVKGPDGSLAVAERQACYDGALGARVPDNKAYTITCTYHGGQLKMYTSHLVPAACPGGPYDLTGNASMFRQGAAAYRNARDWAKGQRDGAIDKANEKVRRDGSKVRKRGSRGDSDSSADELALDVSLVKRRQIRRTRRAGDLGPSYRGNSGTSADELALDMSLVKIPRVKRFRRAGDLRPKRSLGNSNTSSAN
ncbi:hypothetical protein F4803DRAFT_567138 [Xylaria telfairii]|nr:hypothetical protein F4803DRAFT_567138 [Xylaria telfairii]